MGPIISNHCHTANGQRQRNIHGRLFETNPLNYDCGCFVGEGFDSNNQEDNSNDDTNDNNSWESQLVGGFIRFHYDAMINKNKQEQQQQQHVKQHSVLKREQNTRPQNEAS